MNAKKCYASSFIEPIEGLALVTEGGGQRGAFTAGVLDSWLLACFNPFQILIGTSAGAQNIASYLSKQTGYAYSLIANLTRDQHFFNPWRLFTSKNIMDLDWYFAKTNTASYFFDIEQANENAQRRHIRFSASNARKLETQLIDPTQNGWLNALKSSSAIPYLYDAGNLVDGGVTAPIPVLEAAELGAKTIVTIRTTAANSAIAPKPIKQMKSVLCRRGNCPSFIEYFDKHERAYLQAEKLIEQPPESVEIIEIRPQQPLETKVLGSSKQAIANDYKYGFDLGQRFLSENKSLFL